MRKYFSPLLLLLAIASSSIAQINSNDLIPYRKGDKTGYCDINGKIIIKLKYDAAMPFSEGLASVRIKDYWGFIDSTGKQVIPVEFDFAGKFKEGFAEAGNKQGFAGVIDRKGKFVIQPKYRSVNQVPGECFLAEDTAGLCTLFNKNAQVLFANFSARYKIHMNRYLHFEQKVKNRVVKQIADSLLMLEGIPEDQKKELREGFQMVDLQGLYDLEQKKFILYPVYVDFQLTTDTKGMLNEQYEELEKIFTSQAAIPEEYTKRLYYAVEGLNGKGLFSFSGTEIVPAVYDELDAEELLYLDVLPVHNKNGYHLIDRSGKVMTEKPYELIRERNEKNELFEYKTNGKSGLLALNGKEVTPPLFKDVDINGATAICEFDSTCVYINNENAYKTAKAYDRIRSLRRIDLMEIELNGKYGIMDSTGKEILPPQFDKINIIEGYIICQSGKSQQAFDLSGSEIKLNSGSKFISVADKNKKAFLVHRPEGVGFESGGKFVLLKKAKATDDVFCIRQIVGDTTYSWISINNGSGLVMSTAAGAKVIIPINYYADPFNKKRIVVSDTVKEVSGVYTLTGKEVVPIKYYSVEDGRSTYDYDFADFIICSNKIGCVVYNAAGQLIYQTDQGSPSFEAINEAEYTEEMVAGIHINNHYKVFDAATGNFRPYTLKNFEIGETGRFALLQDSTNNWAIADDHFKPLTPFRFKSLKHLVYDEKSDDYILIYENDRGKLGLINDKGKELTPPIYDAIEGGLTENLAMVKQEDKYGQVDLAGKIIVPALFTNAFDLVYNDVFSAKDALGYTALYDENGNCLLKTGLFKDPWLIARGKIAGRNFIYVEIVENGSEMRCFIDETGKVWYDR